MRVFTVFLSSVLLATVALGSVQTIKFRVNASTCDNLIKQI